MNKSSVQKIGMVPTDSMYGTYLPMYRRYLWYRTEPNESA